MRYGIWHHYSAYISAKSDMTGITSVKYAKRALFQQFDSASMWPNCHLKHPNSPIGDTPWLGTPATTEQTAVASHHQSPSQTMKTSQVNNTAYCRNYTTDNVESNNDQTSPAIAQKL